MDLDAVEDALEAELELEVPRRRRREQAGVHGVVEVREALGRHELLQQRLVGPHLAGVEPALGPVMSRVSWATLRTYPLTSITASRSAAPRRVLHRRGPSRARPAGSGSAGGPVIGTSSAHGWRR